ncbi:MAG: sigma-70 family RNA polymerase sigma factor [Planctomycetota bacterium]
MTDATPLPSELLRHGNALRAVARALVSDADEADDVVQSAWLKALERPPATDADRGGLRAWLTRVVRNEVHERRRHAVRRTRRERTRASSERQPAAADVVEQLAVQRAVLEAVEQLEPTQREVVYLRWFENLPPRTIANRLSLSRRAVESRLRRALSQLRQRLDRDHARQDERWLGALVAFSSARRSPVLSTVAATGALTLNTKLLLAALAVSAGAVLYFVATDRTPTPAALAPDGRAATASLQAGTPATPPPPAMAKRDAVPAAVDTKLETPPTDESARQFRGRVLDEHGAPAAGLPVRLIPGPNDPKLDAEYTALRATTIADGSFVMERPHASCIVVSADPAYTTLLAGAPTDWDEPTIVVIGTARLVQGRVVEADDTPVSGAKVAIELPEGFRSRFEFSLGNAEDREWRVPTDALGAFELGTAALDGCRLSVTSEHHEPFQTTLSMHDKGELRIELTRLGTARELQGVVIDATGTPVADAKVALGLRPTATDAQGRFRFTLGDPDEQERLFAVAAGWQPAVVERAEQPGGRWPAAIQLRLTEPPLSIEGVVLDAEGHPHPRAGVWINDPTYFAQREAFSLSAEHTMLPRELLWRRFDTGADGAFRVEGLLDRRYELCAIDLDTAQVVALPEIAAGTRGATLQFLPGDLVDRVEGRVLDRQGNPVADVMVRVNQEAFRFGQPGAGQTFICDHRGAIATSDKDGKFTLLRVPRHGIKLDVMAEGLESREHTFADDTVISPIEIVVTRSCRVRIDVTGSALARATHAVVVDADGTRLLARRTARGRAWIEPRIALTDGRSEVVFVPDSAATLILHDDETELRRWPLRLDPAETTVVRP